MASHFTMTAKNGVRKLNRIAPNLLQFFSSSQIVRIHVANFTYEYPLDLLVPQSSYYKAAKDFSNNNSTEIADLDLTHLDVMTWKVIDDYLIHLGDESKAPLPIRSIAEVFETDSPRKFNSCRAIDYLQADGLKSWHEEAIIAAFSNCKKCGDRKKWEKLYDFFVTANYNKVAGYIDEVICGLLRYQIRKQILSLDRDLLSANLEWIESKQNRNDSK